MSCQSLRSWRCTCIPETQQKIWIAPPSMGKSIMQQTFTYGHTNLTDNTSSKPWKLELLTVASTRKTCWALLRGTVTCKHAIQDHTGMHVNNRSKQQQTNKQTTIPTGVVESTTAHVTRTKHQQKKMKTKQTWTLHSELVVSCACGWSKSKLRTPLVGLYLSRSSLYLK